MDGRTNGQCQNSIAPQTQFAGGIKIIFGDPGKICVVKMQTEWQIVKPLIWVYSVCPDQYDKECFAY